MRLKGFLAKYETYGTLNIINLAAVFLHYVHYSRGLQIWFWPRVCVQAVWVRFAFGRGEWPGDWGGPDVFPGDWIAICGESRL